MNQPPQDPQPNQPTPSTEEMSTEDSEGGNRDVERPAKERPRKQNKAESNRLTEEQIREAERQLPLAMNADQFRLKQQLGKIRKRVKEKKPASREWERFQELLQKSLDRVKQRQRQQPPVTYDPALPISSRVEDIKSAISDHQVIIVCGETGSGKSTQLPKLCLEMGLADQGLIGHTQPRRLAARSIAARLASELSTSLGQTVGFKIRFTDDTSPRTAIKLMTDGILLAETQGDRFLDHYKVIIVDEAHERSLNIDFLLGYIKRLLPKRPDLKLIITSATIDAERFQAHFQSEGAEVPIIEVSGRGYPVELEYRPLQAEDESDDEQDLAEAIGDAIDDVVGLVEGDGLVFLPTEGEIRSVAKFLRGRVTQNPRLRGTEILPLYARLPTKDQNRVFESHSHRRIVLATNVAESSLTVPGIRYVIDTGTARISRYSPRSKVQRLPIESISQASANQRAGRCGRVGPGVCIRLYSEDDFNSRDAFATPEIRRTNLASVILTAKALKLGRIDEFPFVDAPHPESIRDGYRTLFEIGAIDEQQELTDLGRRLSRLPVDPRVGRMILAGDEFHCLSEVLIIASGLEVQDPRDRPIEKQQQADQAHEKFLDPTSDFVSLLNVWDFFHQLKDDLSQSKLRKACQQNFLSYQRVRQWLDVHRQLLRLSKDAGLQPHKRTSDREALHKALLTGLLSGVALKSDRHEYLGARGVKFFPWPGSGVFKQPPDWLMAAEVVETSRRYGRMLAKIKPDWIEPLAGHLVKRQYSDPHYHRKSARCMAFERVILFGLTVVPRRRVAYGKIDPGLSRQLFIEEGLVHGEYESNDEFLTWNRALLEEIEAERARTRQRELLIEEPTIAEFYDERLPSEVIDGPSLKEALKTDRSGLNELLSMKRDDLLPEPETDSVSEQEGFPSRLDQSGMNLQLDYRFNPGAEDDGVTLVVPVDGLQQLDIQRLDWMVPGLLEERIVALIRSLPKRIRRNVTPAPDTAKEIAPQLAFGEGDFLHSVAAALSKVAAERIPVEEFNLEKVPYHLKFHYRVIDEAGEALAEGRDLDLIRQELLQGESPTAAVDDAGWNLDNLTDWEFDELPETVQLRRGSMNVPFYPSLIDKGESVSRRLLSHSFTAKQMTWQGVKRLLVLQAKRDLKSQVNWLPELNQIKLWAATRLGAANLTEQIRDLIALRAVQINKTIPRTKSEWQNLLSNRIEPISIATQDVATLIPEMFKSYHKAQMAVESASKQRFGEALSEIREQLSALLTDDCLTTTPWEWLQQYPRYFDAITHRVEKLPQLGPKEWEIREEINHYWDQYEQKKAELESIHQLSPNLIEYRWMIEEFRVSRYAQQLGTYISVSPQRLEKQWKKVLSSV